LSRVINTESVGKERTQLIRSVVLALRELLKKVDVDDETRDLAAYITLALASIFRTIDISVSAWEKRGYWVKADRFRMDWIWTDTLGRALRNALTVEDWSSVAMISAQIMQKLKDIDVPQRHRIGAPWIGAWVKLQSEIRSQAK